MAEMSMNRVIHGAVRRDLDRFTDALRTLGDSDERRRAQVSAAWTNFHDLLSEFDAEHERMAAALESADRAMGSLRGTPSTEDVKDAGEAMATLRASATEHLDHEEAALEPFLVEHAHTPEMKAMSREFGRDFKLPQAGTFFAWLQDGASRDEKVGLRQNVPAPAVAIIGLVFGGKYRRTIAPAWQGH